MHFFAVHVAYQQSLGCLLDHCISEATANAAMENAEKAAVEKTDG